MCVAARGPRAAAGDAGDRVALARHARGNSRFRCRRPQGPRRSWTGRGQGCHERIAVGAPRRRPAAGIGGRSGAAPGGTHRHARHGGSGARSQGGDHGDPDRLRAGHRSGASRPRGQPQSAGRQYDRHQYDESRPRFEMDRAAARAAASRQTVCVLVNIENADSARSIITRTQEAALALGTQTEILFASNEREIDAALAGLGARAQALIMHPDVLFTQNLEKLAALAIREKLAALYSTRNFPQAGGLMSYGSSFLEAQRQAGVYVGRILKGEKPGELPVQRASKFDFVINLKTAKTIRIDIPTTLLARADEVIE